MSLFEKIKNKRTSLQEQATGEKDTSKKGSRKNKPNRDNKDELYKDRSNPSSGGKSKDTKYQRLKDQRTKYNVLKNKEGVYKPSISSAKAKMGERLTNITQPPDPKATQKNALNASPGRIKKLNKAIKRSARFEPGAGVKDGKDYKTRILDRITKNQEGKIDTSKKGRINRMKAGISAKSPTIPSTTGKGRIPMPGGPNEVDFSAGGKGVNKKGIRTDQAVKNRLSASRDSDLGKVSKNELNKARRQQAAFDKQVKVNQAKLKTPGGAKYYTGKKTPLNKPVLNKSDFNLQKVYDDLSSETSGKNARKRPKNAKSYAQIKAEIDKKYPVKMSKTGLIPDKSTGAYSSANAPLKKPRVINKRFKKISKPELEKIKPKVTTSIDTQNKLGKLSQTKLGNPSSLAKTSRHLLKHKNKYAVGAGLALAGGAYLLGKNRVTAAKTKEKKAISAFNKKEANKPKEMVDVQLFLNRTGTPPKPSTSKFNSVYDKNYIKNLKSKNTTPKTTTPKNNPVSKYTSGVSNAARKSAALPYDSNKIASYAKPSQRSSKK